MARGELHIQLFVDYADDTKLADVSRSARLLYVDALCSAKRTLNDGRFTRAQLRKLAYPESAKTADRLVAELVGTGALALDGDIFTVPAWLKRNKSRAQIEADRVAAEEASLRANHARWHSSRKEPDPKCRFCVEELSASGSASGSGQ